MGKPNNTLLMILTLAAAAMIFAAANVEAAAPSTVCGVKASELAECLPAIVGKSPPRPTGKCCWVMRKTKLGCLCNYKSEFAKYGVDPKNALALPKKCGLKLPRGCKKIMF